jgi:hypothetical protein
MFTLDEEVEEDYILNIPSVLFDLIQYSIYITHQWLIDKI